MLFNFILSVVLIHSLQGQGQGGNPNNICNLSADVGLCDALIPRIYYDSTSGQCTTFYWGGCGGNGNNFANYIDCLLACTSCTKVEGEYCSQQNQCCDSNCVQLSGEKRKKCWLD
eukprot:377405_1